MRLLSAIPILASGFLLVSGCATIREMKANMDAMTYYMGVMTSHAGIISSEMGQMVGIAERMEAKADRRLAKLDEDAQSLERSAQSYAQAFIDGDRLTISKLNAIREELASIRKNLRSRGETRTPREQVRLYSDLRSRLEAVEAKLKALSRPDAGKRDKSD